MKIPNYGNNLFGIGFIHDKQGIVIINPFGELGELDYDKIYDVSKLNINKQNMLMYPSYDVIVSNLKKIRESEPIIYLTPSQEKEIDFLKCFFNTKTIKFNERRFKEWIGISDSLDLEKLGSRDKLSQCLYIYLTLYKKYNLLLNPNIFRNHSCPTYFFKDIETLEKISLIEDFSILKNIIKNFYKYHLGLNYIGDLLFSICLGKDSQKKKLLFEFAKYEPQDEVIELDYDEEILYRFECDGYIEKNGFGKYILHL